ncbi:hypothetical protein Q361_1275 [Flavobacterium croceum DSM 17960]|uniref:Surface-adhesin protein E-like domain-containing protein n=1 Tax=Flavobacterium croceum DSM 17960 TaxID=1121886 RepID=A0A2S4N4Q9_9FLAO|nr:surface-adhesin E family protein [Flavobacterium croceum]POS00718.1 hypothetical protein Q361_1275 [Flavobacterium croceum DSM 17960]
MKKILLLLSLFTFSFSYSQDWKLLFETESETYYYKPNTSETAWIKTISEKQRNIEKGVEKLDAYEITLWKFDCDSKKLGVISSSIYSKDGKVLDSLKIKETVMNCISPESIREKLLKVFCETK